MDKNEIEKLRRILFDRNCVRYINTLLDEVLDDTVKNITDVEKKDDVQRSEVTWQRTKTDLNKPQPDESRSAITNDRNDSLIDACSRLPVVKTRDQWNIDNECKKQFTNVSIGEGYVNPAFVGSTDELTSLSFNRSAGKHSKYEICETQ